MDKPLAKLGLNRSTARHSIVADRLPLDLTRNREK